ncbi:MAG: hypothetical protein NVV59_19770 [Chitinophagaceae bacterium]|nr:hypothetical protein [Chitinophagaceae bacterium]
MGGVLLDGQEEDIREGLEMWEWGNVKIIKYENVKIFSAHIPGRLLIAKWSY